jgi:hypothetical protein
MEAEKMMDEAEHREDVGRIQAKIDAARALDAAQAAEDAADMAPQKAKEDQALAIAEAEQA